MSNETESPVHGFYVCISCRKITLLEEIEGGGCIFCGGEAQWMDLADHEPYCYRSEDGGISYRDSPTVYTVHMYAVVRIPLGGILAGSQKAAILAANRLDLGSRLRNLPGNSEYADYVVGYMVDEEDDEDYVHSQAYNESMEIVEHPYLAPKRTP